MLKFNFDKYIHPLQNMFSQCSRITLFAMEFFILKDKHKSRAIKSLTVQDSDIFKKILLVVHLKATMGKYFTRYHSSSSPGCSLPRVWRKSGIFF